MKKALSLVAFVLVLGLASGLTVKPASAWIESANWLESFYTWGTDPYYGTSVYGYEENSTATLLVEVENHLIQQMNISAVIVGFEWIGFDWKNYTTSYTTPKTLKPGETQFFTVTVKVPLTTEASNLYLHGYKVYVKHLNSTGDLVDTMTRSYGRQFAVYSKDQVQARELSNIIDGIGMPWWGFNSTAANLCWMQRINETNIADAMYEQGDFAGAKMHYSLALDYLNQAYASELDSTGGVQEVELGLLRAQEEYFKAQAAYFSGLSSMWILIGVAAVLFAIGYIIRGLGSLRKPSVATA